MAFQITIVLPVWGRNTSTRIVHSVGTKSPVFKHFSTPHFALREKQSNIFQTGQFNNFTRLSRCSGDVTMTIKLFRATLAWYWPSRLGARETTAIDVSIMHGLTSGERVEGGRGWGDYRVRWLDGQTGGGWGDQPHVKYRHPYQKKQQKQIYENSTWGTILGFNLLTVGVSNGCLEATLYLCS